MEKLLKALNVTTEELFSNDHIKESKELLADISKYVNSVKDKPEKLEKIHKMIRFIVNDE